MVIKLTKFQFFMGVELAALVCGTLYSLSRKYQNVMHAPGLPAATTDAFHHPTFQGLFCFAGHLLAFPMLWCLGSGDLFQMRDGHRISPKGDAVEELQKPRGSVGLILIPTVFDVMSTVLNNWGLILTHLSIYQMLRGSVVIFCGLASRLVLKNVLKPCQVQGLLLVSLGITVIGLANTVFNVDLRPTEYAPHPTLGNLLVIISQASIAGMFVAEEKLLNQYSFSPIEVLAWEGLWGTSLTAVIVWIAYMIPGDDVGSLENVVQATLQTLNSGRIMAAILTMSVVLLLFNIFGIYITKLQSSTHRATVDATRQVVIWLHALIAGWEAFNVMELVGYTFLLAGTLTYNEMLQVPKPTLSSIRWLPERWRTRVLRLYEPASSEPTQEIVDESSPLTSSQPASINAP